MRHVTLRSRVVRLVLLTQQDDEVQVVPDVVLQIDVLFKGHRLVVELVSLQTCSRSLCSEKTSHLSRSVGGTRLLTTDETRGLQNLLLLLFLTSQVGKRVDDDAEDQVENDDDDDEVEEQVVHHSSRKQRLLRSGETGNDSSQEGICRNPHIKVLL